ncbi:MAG: Asp-tRNA(Asn)/Glu-tRNA(Gln) amidotransferase subunit GatC [gamma proteobacterium symbiont of Bathyaustriella thionipta]|nr:Asp-tRNA(Asn)/Glu-tRNA(Gln) amidotransferase subunit GatC [gamma proteobacterium symbiont of Bathyaustriella thionipta]
MSLKTSDVEKIAHLAQLSINDEEAEGLLGELSGILGLVAQMEQVDTTGVEPMAHPLHMNQRLRDDVVSETDQRDKLLALAPSSEAGLILVPQVIE